jgi:hypothetical protein
MVLFKKRVTGPVDPQLPDDEWWLASNAAFEGRRGAYYGSPETMTQGGQVSYGVQDFGVATLFFAKAIDMLHTAYGFSGMSARQPSPADAAIVDGFTSALGASLAMHPNAPVDECIREVDHRLRSIVAECDRVGTPSALYRDSLDRIASYAPKGAD